MTRYTNICPGDKMLVKWTGFASDAFNFLRDYSPAQVAPGPRLEMNETE
jgi:hypothetical protein